MAEEQYENILIRVKKRFYTSSRIQTSFPCKVVHIHPSITSQLFFVVFTEHTEFECATPLQL